MEQISLTRACVCCLHYVFISSIRRSTCVFLSRYEFLFVCLHCTQLFQISMATHNIILGRVVTLFYACWITVHMIREIRWASSSWRKSHSFVILLPCWGWFKHTWSTWHIIDSATGRGGGGLPVQKSATNTKPLQRMVRWEGRCPLAVWIQCGMVSPHSKIHPASRITKISPPK